MSQREYCISNIPVQFLNQIYSKLGNTASKQPGTLLQWVLQKMLSHFFQDLDVAFSCVPRETPPPPQKKTKLSQTLIQHSRQILTVKGYSTPYPWIIAKGSILILLAYCMKSGKFLCKQLKDFRRFYQSCLTFPEGLLWVQKS